MKNIALLIVGAGTLFFPATCIADFLPHLLDNSMNCPSGLTSLDIDQDGRTDIIGTSWDNASVVIWYNTETAWNRINVDTTFSGATFVSASDINQDGTIDLAGTAWDAGEIRCWYSDSQGDWIAQTVAGSLPGAHEVTICDVNSDGNPDLVSAVAGTNEISLWLNDGSSIPSWTMVEISSTMNGARSVCCSDFDRDGDIDVAAAAFSGGSVRWWENSGEVVPVWIEHSLSEGFNGAHMVRAADMDGDGDADLAAVGYYQGDIKVWLNQAEWEEFTVDGGYTSALALTIADLNQDNRPDIAATSENGSRIRWWRNEGFSSGQWPSFNVDTSLPGAWPLTSGDYNLDGLTDLAGGASFASVVRWYENDGTQGIEETPGPDGPLSVHCFPNPSIGAVTAAPIEGLGKQ